jgi:hypothetical protein
MAAPAHGQPVKAPVMLGAGFVDQSVALLSLKRPPDEESARGRDGLGVLIPLRWQVFPNRCLHALENPSTILKTMFEKLFSILLFMGTIQN